MLGTMFETAEDRAVAHAELLLREGYRGTQLSSRQRLLVRDLLQARGVSRAIPLKRLAEELRCTDRDIKQDIHDLRLLFRLRVGTLRTSDGGCYLITSREELLDTVRPFARQAKSEWAIVHAIADKDELRELAGQLQFSVPVMEGSDAE